MVVSRTRLLVSGIAVASLFVALFLRLFYLQVIDGPELAAAAQANQVRTVFEEAPRGRILDRDGAVLVANREVDVVTVDRAAVVEDEELLPRLAAFLGSDVAALQRAMSDTRNSRYKPAIVASSVDKAVVATLKERAAEFPGVTAATAIERWYPNGPLAAHLVGYVGEINADELAARTDAGYRLGDEVGKAGIEAAYEDDLRGRAGVNRIEVDSSGSPVRVLERVEAVPGNDVVLSLDIDVQKAAEDALREGIEAVRKRGSAIAVGLNSSGGSVVAVDPKDGDLLALASFPTYDPARFAGGISVDDYNQLVDPRGGLPLSNRAVSGTYAPGSTFKLVTAIAGIDAGIINANTIINDGGAFYLGGRRFQNAQGRAYGPVDLQESLTVSSDVYYYSLGDKLWASRKSNGDAIQETARMMGLGRTHEVPIAGEGVGRIPDPESRRKMHDERPDVFPEGNWYAGDNVNLAIGQGDTLATPIQLADLYAGFAMRGTVHIPRIVTKVLAPNGDVVKENQPKVLTTYPLPAGMFEPIEAGLQGVVDDPRGTAYNAFRGFDLNAFPVAGKTGTAQVNDRDDNALFAGYGPVGNPEVSVAVVIEQGGFGSQSAAPVARKVIAAVAGQSSGTVTLQEGID